MLGSRGSTINSDEVPNYPAPPASPARRAVGNSVSGDIFATQSEGWSGRELAG
jgi:hypothetical protein